MSIIGETVNILRACINVFCNTTANHPKGHFIDHEVLPIIFHGYTKKLLLFFSQCLLIIVKNRKEKMMRIYFIIFFLCMRQGKVVKEKFMLSQSTRCIIGPLWRFSLLFNFFLSFFFNCMQKLIFPYGGGSGDGRSTMIL